MARDTTIERDAFTTKVAEWSEAPPLALAIADLDGFAELNERKGPAAGDKVLAAVERLFLTRLPAGGHLARIGGDEWAFAFPGRSPEDALVLLEPVRRDLKPLTGSIGIAGLPHHATEPDELFQAAKEAVQRAKRDGGGRSAIYVEEKMVLKSNYYPRGQLARLASLADRLERTEASFLREALTQILERYRDEPLD
jgi:diguanylate cyclase (GGDEF)-like protein